MLQCGKLTNTPNPDHAHSLVAIETWCRIALSGNRQTQPSIIFLLSVQLATHNHCRCVKNFKQDIVPLLPHITMVSISGVDVKFGRIVLLVGVVVALVFLYQHYGTASAKLEYTADDKDIHPSLSSPDFDSQV